jgi:hypothetical protein
MIRHFGTHLTRPNGSPVLPVRIRSPNRPTAGRLARLRLTGSVRQLSRVDRGRHRPRLRARTAPRRVNMTTSPSPSKTMTGFTTSLRAKSRVRHSQPIPWQPWDAARGNQIVIKLLPGDRSPHEGSTVYPAHASVRRWLTGKVVSQRDPLPGQSAAVAAYGGAVLARARDDAADATVGLGRRLLRKVFGRQVEGDPLPAGLEELVADPRDSDALAALRLEIARA